MNSRIRYLILAVFTVAIVQCGAQQQTQPDHGMVKTTSEVIYVQPLTGDSSTSQIVTNQLFLKSMSAMSYDLRIGSATRTVPLRIDSRATNRARVDARSWRLGIEQAERINLMQMNEYRWRNTTIPNSSTPGTFHPAATERMFHAK